MRKIFSRSIWRSRLPLTTQWIIKLGLIYLSVFTLFRIITVIFFRPSNTPIFSLLPSFLLGLRFDIKWIALLLLPIAASNLYTPFTPFYSEKNKKIWSYYLAVVTLVVLFFFGADLGNFSYNHTRINASALNFAEDPLISMRMLWQSYPMVWIILLLITAVILLSRLFKKTHFQTAGKNFQKTIVYKKEWHAFTLTFLFWCLYGLFSFTPLRWKDAFKLNDNFKAYLALNPMQNFFSTLKFRNPVFDENTAKKYYPLVAEFLNPGKEPIEKEDYKRLILPNSHSLESRPNVILVICESFSMYKSSMSGNPLNATPYFKSLCDGGIYFSRCFSPTFGTARGVFATLTGIPDVQLSKFSTRNAAAIDQRTIINDFEDYSKYYFLGGSGDFNNFQGLVKNIYGVKFFQEGDYYVPPLNVWGISDKDLFMEAIKQFDNEKKPFIGVIQTADNHRPYSIPDLDTDFEKRFVPEDTLRKYGFESLKEFQAFCYTDYCFKKLVEESRKKSWFDNTIFVFIGDHGVEGETSAIYKHDLQNMGSLSDEHVPLLFYSPELLTASSHQEVVSQIDVLPTLAGMMHQPYTNTTLGRDLLNTKNKMDAAFIIHHDEGKIGIVSNDFYFTKNLQINKEILLPLDAKGMEMNEADRNNEKKRLSTLTTALYETAKWMLVNNKKAEK